MQLLPSIKKTAATTLSLLLISGFSFANPIGDVRESTGVTSVLRDKEAIQTDKIELYDQAQTAKGRMLIEFLDEAELQLKEHSLVLIDEIYYDPDPSLSKMSLKMAMGTARFASGKLGLVNKANIDIQTPTASIAVRGTDFTTTIDELGRSLVILLPDDKGDPSGTIIVSNDAGSVTLDQAYAATMVATTDSPPTSSTVIRGITPSLIDNMFIVQPPKEVRDRIEEELEDDNVVEDIRDIRKIPYSIKKIILEWCDDDKGRNVIYKNNGDERYPEFKLYKMIARTVNKHTPHNVIKYKYFEKYIVPKKKINSKKVLDIDKLPCFTI